MALRPCTRSRDIFSVLVLRTRNDIEVYCLEESEHNISVRQVGSVQHQNPGEFSIEIT